ncbi:MULTISPECIES: integrase core domain-containing protein [Burkholderia]|uniref:integrase core domain-containing protein n=4 Tax=Burkholderiaceae TaxID=119060 RepID=UPI000DE99EEF|nr:hypothetical protein [Burkholderia contaminans]MBA9835734.1 hypothetical protein [Burkholderia contaminans]MBA9861281.1 hypothetical protein [Burkholderia contaminans]MBA9904714.1 hypothetical protein [Burkholderia contaminans]MBA9927804.1 hypothetical protein [Burkholderia contaminans]
MRWRRWRFIGRLGVGGAGMIRRVGPGWLRWRRTERPVVQGWRTTALHDTTPRKKRLHNLKAYESVSHALRSIVEYSELYNRKQPHSSLADQTPDEAYFATLPAIKSAA